MLESDGGVQPSIRTQGGIIMLPKESAQDDCAWIWTLADGGGIELKREIGKPVLDKPTLLMMYVQIYGVYYIPEVYLENSYLLLISMPSNRTQESIITSVKATFQYFSLVYFTTYIKPN